MKHSLPQISSKQSIYLALAALAMLLCSCQPEGYFTIQGYISDHGSGEPIEGAIVHLQQGFRSGGFGSQSTYISLDSAVTNGDGFYRIEHDLTGVRCACAVDVFKDGYLAPAGKAVGGGDDATWDAEMRATTYIKWHVKNINPFDQWDEIIYFAKNGGGTDINGRDVGPDFEIEHITSNDGGNTPQEITWRVYKNELWTEYKDSVYTPAFDTTLVEIFY